MTYMDIKPKTNDRVLEFQRWMNDMTSRFMSDLSTGVRIEVKTEEDLRSKTEPNVTWWHEQDGEILTIELWNGNGWNVLGLDADFTLGEALQMIDEFNVNNDGRLL